MSMRDVVFILRGTGILYGINLPGVLIEYVVRFNEYESDMVPRRTLNAQECIESTV